MLGVVAQCEQVDGHQKEEERDGSVEVRACGSKHGGERDEHCGRHARHVGERPCNGLRIVADAEEQPRRGDAAKRRHAIWRRRDGDPKVEE